MEEAGGWTRKYYKSNTRIFSYGLPDNADETFSSAQMTATGELASLVETLYAEHGDEIEGVTRQMKPCKYREPQHHEEFVLRELLDRSLIELSEDGTWMICSDRP